MKKIKTILKGLLFLSPMIVGFTIAFYLFLYPEIYQQIQVISDQSQVSQTFPWPPPESSDRIVLHSNELPLEIFKKCQDIGCVSGIISKHLRNNYYNHSYYLIKPDDSINGVAVVTMIERFNIDDGSYMEDEARREPIMNIKDLTFLEKAKVFLVPREGYFRVFVFAITDLKYGSEGTVSKDDAVKWVNAGAQSLDDDIAKLPFTPNFTITALLYEFKATALELDEFKVSEAINISSPLLPTKKTLSHKLPIIKHLQGAKLNQLIED